MPTKHKINRRLALLYAARQVLAEKGFESTTISEIVTRAGVAQGTFYLYFPSKVAVVIALAEELQEQIEIAIKEAHAQAPRPEAFVETSVKAAFRILGEYRDILGVIHSGVCWTEAPRERERIFAPYYTLIAELIRYEQKHGTVHTSIKPEIAAVLIVGLVYYAADECYLYNSAASPETYITETISFIRHAVGVSERTPKPE
ncbi:MAG TPA: TetR family transcriptional regulator [Ktedonobacteraceae bacterium]|nr:TetR family transcriptional regulator [Ktedonobacteraceae bacterium]